MENYFQMHMDKQQIDAISNLGLAHIGDAAYEILCRAYLCAKGGQTVKRLHKESVELVKAPTQAKFADKILPHFPAEDFVLLLA
jgi:ribonuclease-3 family protein